MYGRELHKLEVFRLSLCDCIGDSLKALTEAYMDDLIDAAVALLMIAATAYFAAMMLANSGSAPNWLIHYFYG